MQCQVFDAAVFVRKVFDIVRHFMQFVPECRLFDEGEQSCPKTGVCFVDVVVSKDSAVEITFGGELLVDVVISMCGECQLLEVVGA